MSKLLVMMLFTMVAAWLVEPMVTDMDGRAPWPIVIIAGWLKWSRLTGQWLYATWLDVIVAVWLDEKRNAAATCAFQEAKPLILRVSWECAAYPRRRVREKVVVRPCESLQTPHVLTVDANQRGPPSACEDVRRADDTH